MSTRGLTCEPAAPGDRPIVWHWLGLSVFLALVVGLGFGRSVHDFFLADDFNALYAAKRAAGLGEAIDLNGAFRLRLIREVMPDFEATSTLLRPVTSLSFWLDSLRSEMAPAGYHLSALVLHTLNAAAAAALAFAVSRRFFAAIVTGCVFAVHPAHSEAVVWIAARADLMVTLWMAWSLLAWLRYLERGGGIALLSACVAFVLGLASKEMAVTLPALALIVGLARRPTPWPRAVRGCGALLATLVVYVLIRWALVGSFRSYYEAPGGVLGALGNAATFVLDAATLGVWTGDRLAYPDFDALRAVYALAAAALIALAARHWRAWGRVAIASALMFAVSTAPVAVWARLGVDGGGTRLVYPSLMFLAVGFGTAAAHAAPRRGAALAVAVLTLAGLVGTWRTNQAWHRAAQRSAAIVEGLATQAAGAEALVLCNDLPAKEGPAYLAQNAFPCAAWLFVAPDLRVEWLQPQAWEAAVIEHQQTLEQQPKLKALRWDDAAQRWRAPNR